MEYMQSQKNKYFDLAIVDPPYGIDAGSNKRAGTQRGKSLAKNKIYHSGNWDKDIPPKECFRLMDVSDNDIEKIQRAGICKTEQYKMAGNSIVVSVLYYIFKNLFNL